MQCLTEVCSPSTKISDDYISISEKISLHVITFSPKKDYGHPTIVFVPGWITLIEFWKNVLREMTKEFRVVYVETREKISSKVKKKVKYDVESIGNDIIEIISKLNLKKNEYILFGSSLGATVILDRSRYFENPPLCLVLIGPNAEFRVPKFGMAIIRSFYPPLYFALKPVVKWYLKNFRLNYKSDQAQFKKYCTNLDTADPWKLKRAIIPFSKYEVWDFLNEIDTPILIIGASKDKLHEPENLSKMVTMIKSSSFVDLETNENTHSAKVMNEIYKYITKLPNYVCNCTICQSFRNNHFLE